MILLPILSHILDTGSLIGGVTGVIYNGNKNKNGWLWFILCNVSTIGLAIINGNPGLGLLSVILLGLDIYYYRQWTKQDGIPLKIIRHPKTKQRIKGGLRNKEIDPNALQKISI